MERVNQLCIDASVPPPAANSYFTKAATTDHHAADDRAKFKIGSSHTAVRDMGLFFTPFVMETHGTFHKDTTRIINILANKWASKSSVPLSVAVTRFRQRFSVCVMREIAQQILYRSIHQPVKPHRHVPNP
mmetsp:Transcript_18285/g.48550  ORF Transcript_18285/g.48550 Transcript_18285/m.48550 type:complete len:131 (-) Transcript_18285:53-445(-)